MKISMKNRKIGYTYGSVSGNFSFRQEKSIAFESLLEKDLLTLLAYNQKVLNVVEQPVTLEYINNNGRDASYTPDFLVYFKTNSNQGMSSPYDKPLLIEVKTHDILRKKFDELRPKFKIAMKYAMENGFIFKIYDERRIRGQYFKNVTFLERYRSLEYDLNEEERILNHLEKLGQTSIDHVLAYLYASQTQRGIAIGQIWSMLANHKIACDINIPLTQNTMIWCNLDDSFTEEGDSHE